MKPPYRKSWAGNLMMWSDLTFGPCFKVKRWFTGCGELSFRWIQICIGFPMRRSSFYCINTNIFAILHSMPSHDVMDIWDMEMLFLTVF